MHKQPGELVHVAMDDGRAYAAQVMFRHYGNPNRFMVAWLADAPPGCNEVADWVDADQVSALAGPKFGRRMRAG